MWEQLAKYNNNFLQTQLQFMKAQRINELELKEMRKKQAKSGTCNMLLGKHETCKNALYFEDRAQLAYGLWALPQLLNQLAKDKEEVQWKAIKSLTEYLKNPLHAQRAIKEYDVIRRCANLFLHFRFKIQTKYKIGNACLQILYELSLHRNGAKEIIRHPRLIKVFYNIIKNREEEMHLVSKILAMITRDKCEVVHLTERLEVLDHLFDIFTVDVCVQSYPAELWLHLSHIFEIYPQLAVQKGFFDIIFKRIQGRLRNYHLYDLRCFALLMRCSDGQQRFLDVDAIKEIYEILIDDKRKLTNYEYVVQSIMNGVTAKAVLWRCREFTNMPIYITNLAKQHDHADMQLLCLQCLRQIGVMPCIKRFMQQNCLKDLNTIECSKETNEHERIELIHWLTREIYHTDDLRVLSKPITMKVPDEC